MEFLNCLSLLINGINEHGGVREDSTVFKGFSRKLNRDRASPKACKNDHKKSPTKDGKSIILLFSNVWMIAKVTVFYFR